MNIHDKPSRRRSRKARARLSALVCIMLTASMLTPPTSLAAPPPPEQSHGVTQLSSEGPTSPPSAPAAYSPEAQRLQARASSAPAPAPSAAILSSWSSYTDVSVDYTHYPAIAALADQGVFAGTDCGPQRFCPTEAVPRWVAAVWLVRILDGTDPSPRSSRFADVTGNPWWEPHVERLAELGVTVGCRTSPLRFCPDRKVNRAQMASFLTRAFDMPAGPDAGFTDVDATNTHYDNINALFASGVTVGCRTNPLQYCPGRATTRAQMATFLWRVSRPAFTDMTFEPEYEPLANVAYNYAPYDPTIGESTHVTVIYCSENPSYTDTSFNAHVSELQAKINDFLARESGTLADNTTPQRRYEFSSGGVVSPSNLVWTKPLSDWGTRNSDGTNWNPRPDVDKCLIEAGKSGDDYTLIVADVEPGKIWGFAWPRRGPAVSVSLAQYRKHGGSIIGYRGTIAHELGHAFDGFRHPWYDHPSLCHNIPTTKLSIIDMTEDDCNTHTQQIDNRTANDMLGSLMSYPSLGASQNLDFAHIACYQKANKQSYDNCATESPPKVPEPSNGSLSLAPRANSLSVSWDAFKGDERAPVTGYEIQYRLADDDNQSWATWPHHSTIQSANITGLRSSTAYQVQVRAINSIGPSVWLSHQTTTLDRTTPIVQAFLRVGDSAQGVATDSGLCGAYCRWLHVELRDQNGNEINTGQHTLACAHKGIQQVGASGGVYRSAVVTDWPAKRTCLFGYPGSEVFVIVGAEQRDGVWYGGAYSNGVIWPDCVAEPQKCGSGDGLGVQISWGSDASNNSSCPANENCRYLNYEYKPDGAWPSPPYTVECWHNGQRVYGPFQWTGRAHTGCWYSGGTAQVVINGVRSNTITFSDSTVPDREVRISWGSDASNRSDCPANTNCRNLNYEYIGDWPSPPYSTECWNNGRKSYGPFQWSGRPHTGCYYWGGTAQVVIDGIRSNTITFPGT